MEPVLRAGASAQAPQFFGGAFPSALPGAFSLPPLNPQIVQDWQSRLRGKVAALLPVQLHGQETNLLMW